MKSALLLLCALLPASARALTPPAPNPRPVELKPVPPAHRAPAKEEDDEDDEPAASTAAAKGAPAEEDEEEDPGSFSPSVELGVSGSMGREANSEDHNWGPKLSVDIACTPRHHPFVIGYGMEASYDDAETKLTTAENSSRTRTRFVDVRYAKVSFLKLFGFDVTRLGFTPYVATGVQYADQRSEEVVKSPPDPDEVTVSRDYYWSSTWGFGAEVPVGTRATLVLDVDQNTRGGLRYSRRLSVELKFRVFGDGE